MVLFSRKKASPASRLSIKLIDKNPEMVRAWRETFGEQVCVMQGDILQEPADALVSPANSFGEMGGGLDLAIRDRFGFALQTRVQEHIRKHHYGELLVGQAIIAPLSHASFSYLITAPTMRTPGDVSQSINAFLAMRALLRIAHDHPKIHSVSIPGLCSLAGQMPEPIVARQMFAAFEA